MQCEIYHSMGDEMDMDDILFAIEFYKKNLSMDKFPWSKLCETQEFDIDFYQKYEDYFDINDIIEHQYFVTDDIIRKHSDKIDWVIFTTRYNQLDEISKTLVFEFADKMCIEFLYSLDFFDHNDYRKDHHDTVISFLEKHGSRIPGIFRKSTKRNNGEDKTIKKIKLNLGYSRDFLTNRMILDNYDKIDWDLFYSKYELDKDENGFICL